ncbi:MAG: hypothetical protein HC797_08700 [Anaerolineales bacterium]|nr:hypothetical protein [Anaerolineales bacterium]
MQAQLLYRWLMLVLSILLAFLNSLAGVLLILSCISANETLLWVTTKTSAGLLALYFGILAFKDTTNQKKILLNSLWIVIISVSGFVWGVHWSIASGDIKLTLLLFSGSLFLQGLTSIFGMLQPE